MTCAIVWPILQRDFEGALVRKDVSITAWTFSASLFLCGVLCSPLPPSPITPLCLQREAERQEKAMAQRREAEEIFEVSGPSTACDSF